jgi:hypothetical protein
MYDQRKFYLLMGQVTDLLRDFALHVFKMLAALQNGGAFSGRIQ